MTGDETRAEIAWAIYVRWPQEQGRAARLHEVRALLVELRKLDPQLFADFASSIGQVPPS